MLEVRYIKDTGVVTGWCGDEKQFTNLDRGRDTEAIVLLDIPIPAESCGTYLFDKATQTLVNNPEFPSPDLDYDRACELLATSSSVITQPEIWELLRIFGKKLGYRKE